MLLFGDYKQRIPVRIFTDSEPTLESIASTKQIERKSLRMTVQEMKERLIKGDVCNVISLDINKGNVVGWVYKGKGDG